MRFDVHWRKVRMFLMDFRWTREWNLTRLKERKKHRKVSLQQGKIDWGKKRKKVTQEDKQKGKVIHGMNNIEYMWECLRKCWRTVKGGSGEARRDCSLMDYWVLAVTEVRQRPSIDVRGSHRVRTNKTRKSLQWWWWWWVVFGRQRWQRWSSPSVGGKKQGNRLGGWQGSKKRQSGDE